MNTHMFQLVVLTLFVLIFLIYQAYGLLKQYLRDEKHRQGADRKWEKLQTERLAATEPTHNRGHKDYEAI